LAASCSPSTNLLARVFRPGPVTVTLLKPDGEPVTVCPDQVAEEAARRTRGEQQGLDRAGADGAAGLAATPEQAVLVVQRAVGVGGAPAGAPLAPDGVAGARPQALGRNSAALVTPGRFVRLPAASSRKAASMPQNARTGPTWASAEKYEPM
jgi:hypothetical protein